MNPGATTRFGASIVVVGRRVRPSAPIAVMRSPTMPTSPRNHGAPVPSTMRPLVMTTSNARPLRDGRATPRGQPITTADTSNAVMREARISGNASRSCTSIVDRDPLSRKLIHSHRSAWHHFHRNATTDAMQCPRRLLHVHPDRSSHCLRQSPLAATAALQWPQRATRPSPTMQSAGTWTLSGRRRVADARARLRRATSAIVSLCRRRGTSWATVAIRRFDRQDRRARRLRSAIAPPASRSRTSSVDTQGEPRSS